MRFRRATVRRPILETQRIAWRYFKGNFIRYRFFLLTAGIGFAIITTMTGLSTGMKEGIRQAAHRHYGGDIFVMGFPENHEGNGRITQDEALQDALAEAGLDGLPILRRTNLFRHASIYHEGSEVPLKYVMGIDWNLEKTDMASLEFTQGRLSTDIGSGHIVISDIVAQELGVSVGDELLLKTRGPTGRSDVGSFLLKAVYSGSDVFGVYKAFIGRKALNRMVGYDDDDYSYLALNGDSLRRLPESELVLLQGAVAERLGKAVYIRDRQDLHRMQGGSWDGTLYFIVTLEAFISEADDLFAAMDITSNVIFGLILLILMASVFITYRLILRERTEEIGTLRAIGMSRFRLVEMLLWEGFFLSVTAILLGLFAASVLRLIVTFLPLSGIPGFEVFLRKGRLPIVTLWQSFLTHTVLLCFSILLSILISVWRVLVQPLIDCFGEDG